MMHETPLTIANAIQRDIGIEAGIRYAEAIATTATANQSEMGPAYKEAASILRSRLAEQCPIGWSHV